MKNKELIHALLQLDQDAEVVINIKQSNKVYGVLQLPVVKTTHNYNGVSSWITPEYGGCCITVFLPEYNFISTKKKSK